MSHHDEFELIKQYFQNQTPTREDVVLGIGDDAALLRVAQEQLLVATTDCLVEDVHFPKTTTAQDLAYKALAVNLSDLAAMGAEPLWFTLALTLPQVESSWLKAFSQGLFLLAREFNVQLIGGDTTRGPLSLTIQALGRVPKEQALLRQGAKPGDKIYVSGTLGDAGLGLAFIQGKVKLSSAVEEQVLQRLNRPTPRIALGLLLREIASSAIDISDGLAADLGHILESSQVGATLLVEKLPLSPALQEALSPQEAQTLALSAGDDYELCFTIPGNQENSFLSRLAELKLPCTCIGEIRSKAGLDLIGFTGKLTSRGYQHFAVK